MVLCQTAPPTCVLVGREPCSVCQEASELERKIQELQDKRHAIQTRMNANHDPLNSGFPPEITSHIFSLSMGIEDYEPRHSTLRKLPTQFLLGSVSRWWRQLSRSTPQLWSTISFTLVKKNTNSLPPLQFINDWLRLSGSLPLTLWITEHAAIDFPWETCREVVDSLIQHSRRWHKVSLHLNTRYFSLFRGTSSPSNLYDLQVRHSGQSPIDETSTTHFSMNSRPSPTHLTIYNYRLSALDVAWGNVKFLTLGAITSRQCIEAIKLAPLLESCTLSEIYVLDDDDVPSGSWTFHSQHAFSHTHLRKLAFWGTYGSRASFIDTMELPSLEVLQCQLDNDSEVALISLLNRSGIRLQRLALLVGEDLQSLEVVLSCVPSLQKLECEFRYENSTFLVQDLFQNMSSSRSRFLPKLDYLALCAFSDGFGWENIFPMYDWPQRKLLSLRMDFYGDVRMNDVDSAKFLELVDQGFNIRILEDGEDYLEKFRQGIVCRKIMVLSQSRPYLPCLCFLILNQ